MAWFVSEDIARIAHDITRSYQIGLGNPEPVEWERAQPWEKEASLNGVTFHLAHPEATPEDSHVNWMNEKLAMGWKQGPEKNETTKEHPDLVPYSELPKERRLIDHLYLGTVKALQPYLKPPSGGMSSKAEEHEITVFGRILNPEVLETLQDFEVHHQLESRMQGGGKSRVRQTIRQGQSTYVYTLKIKTESVPGVTTACEYNLPADQAFFEGFKQTAENYFIKTRYRIPSETVTLTVNRPEGEAVVELPGVLYEVDVYTQPDGTPCPWCKIDIEVDGLLAYLSTHYPTLAPMRLTVSTRNLPIQLGDKFINEHATPEQRALVDQLFKTHYQQPLGREDAPG
jgi:hypothetical protein